MKGVNIFSMHYLFFVSFSQYLLIVKDNTFLLQS